MESLTLAAGGAQGGLAIAYGGVRLLRTLGASELPRLDTVPFDGWILASTAGVLLISSVLVGVAPAVRLARLDIVTLIIRSSLIDLRSQP